MIPHRAVVFLCLSFLLMACSHQKHHNQEGFYVNEIGLQQMWLPFLEDGISKDVVESRLGRPFLKYEDGRIWTYTLALEEGRFRAAPWGQYRLVLVFHDDTLQRHSLLRFRQ